MLGDIDIDRVYLACGSIDLRKSIDRLAILVKEGNIPVTFYLVSAATYM
ncbi:hypothetical protein C2W64_04285 [Brevibacillus laterosporus]|nr:transposase [Brevibacillus laterosporus]RAP19136.1 hypothetical protein C2W64_04285 [Brevibacillus laterosporus]